MARSRTIPDEQKDQFLRDYGEVGSAAALAEKWSISFQTTLSYLKRFGVNLRSGKKLSEHYPPKLGIWTDARVARDLGITQQSVAEARARRGIESPMARALRIMGEDS